MISYKLLFDFNNLNLLAFIICFFLIGFFITFTILIHLKIERIFPKNSNIFIIRLLYFLLPTVVGMIFSIFINQIINIFI